MYSSVLKRLQGGSLGLILTPCTDVHIWSGSTLTHEPGILVGPHWEPQHLFRVEDKAKAAQVLIEILIRFVLDHCIPAQILSHAPLVWENVFSL